MGIPDCIHSRRKYLRSLRTSLLLLVCILFIVFLNFSQTSASVTLLYFQALPENDAVFLEWETATEIDSAGFYITRSTSESSNFERIGSFIPSKGDSVAGAYYDFRDEAVENGVTYNYILESWDYDNTVDYSDPVSATPGTEGPTPTSTVTPTQTGDPSPTATQDFSETPTTDGITETPTLTNTPEETNTPAYTSTNTTAPNPTASLTQTGTPTTQGTAIPPSTPTTTAEMIPVTPTATLAPLPAIVIVYPTSESTITSLPSPTPTFTQEPEKDNLRTGFRIIGLIGLVCVVGLVWVMLVLWIYLLIRQLSTKK